MGKKPVYIRFPNLWPTTYRRKLSNSRTTDDIDMKRGSVTEFDKRNKTTTKNFDDDLRSGNYEVIDIFSIYGQFPVILT